MPGHAKSLALVEALSGVAPVDAQGQSGARAAALFDECVEQRDANTAAASGSASRGRDVRNSVAVTVDDQRWIVVERPECSDDGPGVLGSAAMIATSSESDSGKGSVR